MDWTAEEWEMGVSTEPSMYRIIVLRSNAA